MTLTPEHREALIAEARRRTAAWMARPQGHSDPVDHGDLMARHTLDLIETGWKPEPKPSKALLAAREAAGKHTRTLILYVNGHGDDMPIVQAALEAYNLGRESVLGEGAREIVKKVLAGDSRVSRWADEIITALKGHNT